MKHTLELYKTAYFFNPLSVTIGEKSYELDNILFYDNEKNEVVTATGSGWFGEYSSNVTLLTSKALKRKIKKDFSKNEPFIIKSDNWHSNRYDLYLPITDFLIVKSYSKVSHYIYADWLLYDEYKQPCTWRTCEKTLNISLYNIMNAIEEIGKKFSDWYIQSMKKDEFYENINMLKELYEQYNNELEYIKNYTVEDYLKELNKKEVK